MKIAVAKKTPENCPKTCRHRTFHFCMESGTHCDKHCVCPCEQCKKELQAKWDPAVKHVRECLKRLTRKPKTLKLGYRLHPGAILNAYTEGDLTFKQAVKALECWRRVANNYGL